MNELAETVHGGAARGAAGAGLAKLVLFFAFAVFTVWIHYQVKFVRAPTWTGTVQALGALRVGARAPDFTTSDLDGHPVSLSGLRDRKAVLLEFWATWCPPCRMLKATLHEMRSELEATGVEVFTVNAGESPDRVRAFVDKAGDDFRTVLDNGRTISVRYGVRTLPTMVLVDRRGTVRRIHVGHLPETGELRDLLHRLAGE